MPAKKEVQSLQTIALTEIGNLVITSCLAIESRYGKCGNEICQQQVAELQGYLLSKIGPLLDYVFHTVQVVATEEQYVNLEYLYAVVLRSKIKALKLGKPCGNAFNFFKTRVSTRQAMNERSFANCFHTCPSFWIDQMRKFENLVELDICRVNLGSRVDIFRDIIMNNKHTLQKICFTPSVPTIYFIDVLGYLQECDELTAVKIFWPTSVAEKPTKELLLAVNKFVESLPHLELLDIQGIGTILSSYVTLNIEGFQSSSLKYLPLQHSKIDLEQLTNLLRDCPNLKELELSSMSYVPYRENYRIDTRKVTEVLCQSQLQYTSLWLNICPHVKEMDNIWIQKGAQLRKLKLYPGVGPHASRMSYSQFVVIGQMCPNLEVLEAQTFGDSGRYTTTLQDLQRDSTPKTFAKLTHLCLHNCFIQDSFSEGQYWNPMIIPLIMQNLNVVVDIKLFNVVKKMFDATLAQLRNIPVNSLSKLESLTMIGSVWGGTCAGEMLPYILEHCPKLVYLNVHSRFSGDAITMIQNFQTRIKTENLDLKLLVINTRNGKQIAP